VTGQYAVVARAERDRLGEGPLWSPRDNALYWVDILGQLLWRLRLETGEIRSWAMPEMIGWVIERRDRPGFVAGFQSGFAELSLDPVTISRLADPEPELPANRLNDAVADAAGRIWAGTMPVTADRPTGSLYRFDPGGTVTRLDSGYIVTNGPAISLDQKLLYHSDTGRGIIYRFPLRDEGSLGQRSEFIRFAPDWGHPDGMTVDAEDHLWVAHWGGSRISRFAPDGTLDRTIPLPASQITSCAFAGSNLNRMFVTSAAVDRAEEPLAGCLFEVDPGVRGIVPGLFAG
jgi:xylono-1,5-lactonase